MNEARIDTRPPRDANIANDAAPLARRAADGLTFAAAPVFAVMAVLTAAHRGGPADILCSAAHDASPLSGMGPMYALMAVFHAVPWVRLVSGRP